MPRPSTAGSQTYSLQCGGCCGCLVMVSVALTLLIGIATIVNWLR